MYERVLERIEKAVIIPIVVIEDPNKAVQLGRTILDAGIDIIEITIRTERALEAIKILNTDVPEILIGAGTVFSISTAEDALDSGAKFIVSPHFDEKIVTYCIERDITCIPGVFTPSEVQSAINVTMKIKEGASLKDLPLVLKIFPASTGGPEHIKAMKAVFPQVRFIPLGGVNANNLADYLKAGAWAIGGTWVCKKDLIDRNDFGKISELIKQALNIVKEIRK